MTLSLQQLGDGLGMSKQAAAKHVAKGMPRNSMEAAIEWYTRNKNPAQKKRQPLTTGVDRQIRVANDESFDQARTRKEIALADQAEMLAAERAGELIEKAKVKAELGKQFAPIREGLLNIPARLAPELHAAKTLAEVQTMLDTEIRAVLAQYVGEP